MDCDWIFINDDQANVTKTINEPQLPHIGDGKIEAGKDYVVVTVVTGRVANKNPTVIAVQHATE